MASLNTVKNLSKDILEGSECTILRKTGDFKKDVKEINDYVVKHPEKFTQPDICDERGSVLCRSRLVKKPLLPSNVEGYVYVRYNKDGVEVGWVPLDIY